MRAKWEVRSFYGRAKPEQCGKMNIHTWHTSDVSKDIEVESSKSRPDIGRVEVLEVNSDKTWETVYWEPKE